jgi:hypothetical protein
VGHVFFGYFNKIGDKIMTALELNIDLGKRVFVPVPAGNQPVVDADNHENQQYNESHNYQESSHHHAKLLSPMKKSGQTICHEAEIYLLAG